MSALPKPQWTIKSYLAFEEASEVRHEYLYGEVYAMTGASKNHNLIVATTITSLGTQLAKRPCAVFPSDQRLRVSAEQYSYPDISVVCGEPQFGDEKPDTLLNPTVLIEVLSPSTEGYDRGKKSEGYRKLKSLQEYLLISQEKYHIEHYVRQNNKWVVTDVNQLDATIELTSIECTLAVADIYQKVKFDDESS